MSGSAPIPLASGGAATDADPAPAKAEPKKMLRMTVLSTSLLLLMP
jgi:hypothetical protein